MNDDSEADEVIHENTDLSEEKLDSLLDVRRMTEV